MILIDTYPSLPDVAPEEWKALASRRIFFGHKSVGRNIMAGVRRLVDRNPQIGLRVVSSDAPATIEGPALIEGEIGSNRQPETKDRAFSEVLAGGFGDEPGAVAMYKYCYVDMQPDTEPERLLRQYSQNIDAIRTRHPSLMIVHFTIPLHEAGTGWIDRLKTRLGQPTQIALNIKRNRFNELLRARYGASDPLFDLALLESTRSDGSRTYSRYRGETVYMLAPEWTYDGGHLTDPAQDQIAQRLLVFLARLGSPGEADKATGGAIAFQND